MSKVSIIGGYNTAFGNFVRKDKETGAVTDLKSIYELLVEAGRGAIGDAGMDAADVDAVWVASCAPGVFANQEHLGALGVEVAPEALRYARVAVLASDYEGMPNALMEALALGVPAVATDCSPGGARMLIENGYNGFLVPRGDYEQLAGCLLRLLAERVLAEQLAEHALLIRERYQPEAVLSQWEGYLQQVAGRCSHA